MPLFLLCLPRYPGQSQIQGNVKEGYDAWKEYVESFGFGRKLGSDFLDERDGYVPDRGWYDRQYRGSWNSLTVISLAIGQDALGCTPLQLANLAAIVANRGYYYIPHIVKKVEGRDSLRPPFLRAPLYEGRPQAFRADRRGHVAGRQRRRHVDAGPARRARCLR